MIVTNPIGSNTERRLLEDRRREFNTALGNYRLTEQALEHGHPTNYAQLHEDAAELIRRGRAVLEAEDLLDAANALIGTPTAETIADNTARRDYALGAIQAAEWGQQITDGLHHRAVAAGHPTYWSP